MRAGESSSRCNHGLARVRGLAPEQVDKAILLAAIVTTEETFEIPLIFESRLGCP